MPQGEREPKAALHAAAEEGARGLRRELKGEAHVDGVGEAVARGEIRTADGAL